MLQGLYGKLDVSNAEDPNEPQDVNGYLGQTRFYRDQVAQREISPGAFIHLLSVDNKLESIMATIKEIDKDHNGYVTQTELTDIIKLKYPGEMTNFDFK